MNIVPHNKPAERKQTQKGEFFHIPTALLHNTAAHGTENQSKINAIAVLRQWSHSRYANSVKLPEHFQQSYIHPGFLLTHADSISAGTRLPNQFYRNQDKRSIPGPLTYLRLIPPKESERYIQGIGAVLLHTFSGIPIQDFQIFFQFLQREKGPYSSGIQLRRRNSFY